MDPASGLCDVTRDALKSFIECLGSIDIAIKRGPDAAPERKLIEALANIHRLVTGREAGRVVLHTDGVSRESGDLLALAQAVVELAGPHLGDDVPRPAGSLSKIVREVLEVRRRP